MSQSSQTAYHDLWDVDNKNKAFMGLLSIIFRASDAGLVSETMPRLHVKLLSALMLKMLHIYDQPNLRMCEKGSLCGASKHCHLVANGEKCNAP